MKYADLESEQNDVRGIIDALTVRASDAEARRLEAYDFARVSSDAAHGARRELETLKRDIAAALDTPVDTGQTRYDPRHRDIVESMERLFLGTVATHHMARNPLVERIERLSAEVQRLSAEVEEQCERAKRAENFADDWHAQLLSIRKSMSWRLTKPFRFLSRPFRNRRSQTSGAGNA